MQELYSVLSNEGMIDWNVIMFGFEKKYFQRNEVSHFTEKILEGDDISNDLKLLLGAEFLKDEEIVELLQRVIVDKRIKLDGQSALDKIRYARLLILSEKPFPDELKIEKLQEIYSEFEYPIDMEDCSIYSRNRKDPLKEMLIVIHNLKKKISVNLIRP